MRYLFIYSFKASKPYSLASSSASSPSRLTPNIIDRLLILPIAVKNITMMPTVSPDTTNTHRALLLPTTSPRSSTSTSSLCRFIRSLCVVTPSWRDDGNICSSGGSCCYYNENGGLNCLCHRWDEIDKRKETISTAFNDDSPRSYEITNNCAAPCQTLGTNERPLMNMPIVGTGASRRRHQNQQQHRRMHQHQCQSRSRRLLLFADDEIVPTMK